MGPDCFGELIRRFKVQLQVSSSLYTSPEVIGFCRLSWVRPCFLNNIFFWLSMVLYDIIRQTDLCVCMLTSTITLILFLWIVLVDWRGQFVFIVVLLFYCVIGRGASGDLYWSMNSFESSKRLHLLVEMESWLFASPVARRAWTVGRVLIVLTCLVWKNAAY
jgi:hypothetical protein